MTSSDTGELEKIPGVGRKIAQYLRGLDIRSVEDLRDRDPEELYFRLSTKKGMHIDRCVLYVFRCAVYYSSNKDHDPELLKWWKWKDE